MLHAKLAHRGSSHAISPLADRSVNRTTPTFSDRSFARGYLYWSPVCRSLFTSMRLCGPTRYRWHVRFLHVTTLMLPRQLMKPAAFERPIDVLLRHEV